MRPNRFLITVILAFVVAFASFCTETFAQSAGHAGKSRGATATVLSNGIQVTLGELHESVIALRPEVLRVRMWRGGTAPEDASWAVLPEARSAAEHVTAENSAGRFGFRTAALGVEIDNATLELTVRDMSGAIVQQDARPVRLEGDTFRVYKAMPVDEHYFGLGDKTGPLDRRNEAFTMWNTDAYRFQESTDPLYKDIPFFITFRAGRAVGVLLDNTWRSSFDFGKESPDVYSFGAPGGPLDYYVVYGPTPRQVVETYAWLTGKPPLPPLWSLGYQQSRYSYMTQARVLEVAAQLRADRIPADAIYIDIDFQEKNRPFTVDRVAFPDLPGMVGQLKAEHFHLVAITDLHIANLPGQGYSPFESGIAGDHFVKKADGSVYSGRVWPGASVFPDFTRQQTREWWGKLYTALRGAGVDGIWNDMNEPSIFEAPAFTMPLTAVHRIDEPGFAARTATHAEIHNVYGMENSRATFDGLLALDPATRPFVLTRATYAGGQRYAVTWTGDNSSTWNHLRMTTPMLENLGLSGFAFSGADVGGYAGTPTAELLTRWFEIGAFQPIDRDHTEKGTGDQEPWIGGADQEDIRRHYIETRYQLLPYLYTLAEEASRTGLPMLRPLFLEFPDAAADHHPLDIDPAASSEFLLGPDLLVAPPQYPDSTDAYPIEFPSAGWYDFWTGAAVPAPPVAGNPAPQSLFQVELSPRISELPVFVRGGAILPMAPIVESTDESPKGPLTLRVYAGQNCAGSIYQDDGGSYAFRTGSFLRQSFTCQVSGDEMRLRMGPREGSYRAWWKEIRVEIYGWSPTQDRLLVNGRSVTTHIDHDPHRIGFTIADDSGPMDVELK